MSSPTTWCTLHPLCLCPGPMSPLRASACRWQSVMFLAMADATPTLMETTPARVTPMEMMPPTTDVLTFIIQFIYCRNKSLDQSQPVFEGQPNWIGLVLFSSVVVLQVGAMVWTGCGPQLPLGGQKPDLTRLLNTNQSTSPLLFSLTWDAGATLLSATWQWNDEQQPRIIVRHHGKYPPRFVPTHPEILMKNPMKAHWTTNEKSNERT